jgi:hypothetical protein
LLDQAAFRFARILRQTKAIGHENIAAGAKLRVSSLQRGVTAFGLRPRAAGRRDGE